MKGSTEGIKYELRMCLCVFVYVRIRIDSNQHEKRKNVHLKQCGLGVFYCVCV